jgi:tRNA A37 N6-isopentenylltransferase MiaA
MNYESNDYEKIKRALEIFESIKTYRFSESYISKCEEKMNTPEIRAQKEKLNKTQRKNLMSGFILALVLLGIAIGLFVIGNELF